MGINVVQSSVSYPQRRLCPDQLVSPLFTTKHRHARLISRSAILVACRKSWGYLFNSDPEVVEIVATVLPFIALFQVSLLCP